MKKIKKIWNHIVALYNIIILFTEFFNIVNVLCDTESM